MRTDSPLRSFDLISLLILEGMFLVSGLGLMAADWAEHLDVVLAIGALAVVAGAALGYSRFSSRNAALFTAAYGIFVVGSQVGGTLDRALAWGDRISDLLGRLGAAAGALVRGDASLDPLMFVLIIGCIYWLFGVIAGWAVFRRGGLWAAVLPGGVGMLINAYFYAGGEKLGQDIATYLLISLLLAARLELRSREASWRSKWSQVSTDVAYHVGRAGVITAFALVALAWGGPAFAQSKTAADLWTKAAQPWSGIKERLGHALDSLRRETLPVYDPFGDSLPLGAGTSLPKTVVLRVQLAQPPSPTTRLYWQSHTYETYEDGRWEMGPGEEIILNPEENELPLVVYAQRDPIEGWFRPSLPAIKVLPVPGQTVWVNRTVTAQIRRTGQGVVDIAKVSAADFVRAGETYHLWGWVTDPAGEALRQAGQKYPSWVVPSSLQLPASVTARTRELAASISDGAETPYDKAVAITEWLRENIEYSRDTLPPPEYQEPIDWFLFDYRIGYCNYYASAEVIMLRSLGIPARLAVGYASGTDAGEGSYEVHADDAHAWPEVFFPGIGWVQFEPTASQPALVRPKARESSEQGLTTLQEFDPLGGQLEDDQSAPPDQLEPDRGGRLLWLGLITTILGILVTLIRTDTRLWARVSSVLVRGLLRVGVRPPKFLESAQRPSVQSTAGQLHAAGTIWLDRLGPRLTSDQTPFERAALFADRFPACQDEGWKIADAYAAERYGNITADARPLRQVWRGLLPRMRRTWLRRRLGATD